ncbi:hypothetical protein EXU57_17800 [Segetibacter sp. 3557_3]|uniref:hypothetical protein n=1 Tax=Segetibacter sp. 3557_3 TaxID=2547429 RepID=UPI00105884A2|nr:hypothetical protein [Segetibacter sp. 3557_3]TDH23327.1 hypothetical protein EXU57_17800 [Segetibacter sp. 3557_3]
MREYFKFGINALLYPLVFVLLMDPADRIFRLKLPLFALIFGLWLLEKIVTNKIKTKKDSLILILVYFLISVTGIFVALVQNNFADQGFAFGFLKSLVVLVLLFLIDDYGLRIDTILIRASIVLPIMTVGVFFVFLYGSGAFIHQVFLFFAEENGAAAFSLRNFYGFELSMFFFKTSPLLVFPMGYYTHKLMKGEKPVLNTFLVVTFLITMILSGTRANILSAFLILIIIVFLGLAKKRNKFPLLLASMVMVYLVSLFISRATFAKADVSQQAKTEHLDAYVQLFNNNPEYLIWGQGLGSVFYSRGFSNYVPQSELTYIDLIRMFGIPLGLVFILFTFYPVFSLLQLLRRNKEVFYSLISFTAYLFIAGTNPLLISSTGMLAILAVFSTINYASSSKSKPFVSDRPQPIGGM